jgi:hypothetical protein
MAKGTSWPVPTRVPNEAGSARAPDWEEEVAPWGSPSRRRLDPSGDRVRAFVHEDAAGSGEANLIPVVQLPL